MKKLFDHKSFKVFLGVISVLLVLAVVTAGNSAIGTYIVNLITLPMQQVTVGAVDSAGNAVPQKSAEELTSDVESLTEENKRLRDMLVDYYEVKEQNEQFKKYYDLKEENPDYDILPATVIRRDPNENFYGFTIDKGSVDGVERHDPVVTENGLVGWVCELDATSCTVKTILSPDTQVGALDAGTSDSGIITGSPTYCDDNLCTMTKVPAQHTMKKGDIIVTSGLGGIFPKKLQIGKVKEIKLNEYDSLPLAVIEPFEDIRSVTSVAVITNYLDKGKISKSESKPDNSSASSSEGSRNDGSSESTENGERSHNSESSDNSGSGETAIQ